MYNAFRAHIYFLDQCAEAFSNLYQSIYMIVYVKEIFYSSLDRGLASCVKQSRRFLQELRWFEQNFKRVDHKKDSKTLFHSAWRGVNLVIDSSSVGLLYDTYRTDFYECPLLGKIGPKRI